jgi:hypothetical protein
MRIKEWKVMDEDKLVCPLMSTGIHSKRTDAVHGVDYMIDDMVEVECIQERCAVWITEWIPCAQGCKPGACPHYHNEAGFDNGHCGLRWHQ